MFLFFMILQILTGYVISSMEGDDKVRYFIVLAVILIFIVVKSLT